MILKVRWKKVSGENFRPRAGQGVEPDLGAINHEVPSANPPPKPRSVAPIIRNQAPYNPREYPNLRDPNIGLENGGREKDPFPAEIPRQPHSESGESFRHQRLGHIRRCESLEQRVAEAEAEYEQQEARASSQSSTHSRLRDRSRESHSSHKSSRSRNHSQRPDHHDTTNQWKPPSHETLENSTFQEQRWVPAVDVSSRTGFSDYGSVRGEGNLEDMQNGVSGYSRDHNTSRRGEEDPNDSSDDVSTEEDLDNAGTRKAQTMPAGSTIFRSTQQSARRPQG